MPSDRYAQNTTPPARRAIRAETRKKMKMNVWHDDGDDGVTGWQPIGEPLIRTKEGTNS